MKVPDELVEAAADRLNDYGNERDWQKMRPDEMAGIALEAVLPKVRERLVEKGALDAAYRVQSRLGSVVNRRAEAIQAAFDHAFPEEGS